MGNDKKMARIVPTAIYLFTSLFLYLYLFFSVMGSLIDGTNGSFAWAEDGAKRWLVLRMIIDS